MLERLLRQPTLHFFVLGALLFLAHHLKERDERTIVVTPGVRAEIARRFQDEAGRAPNATEAQRALAAWKREESLYREALRQRLDRDDRMVRTLLVEKLRAAAMSDLSKPAPTEAELRGWLATHQALYEAPPRYSVEWFAFEKARPDAASERARLKSKVAGNLPPDQLGAPLYGATLTPEALRERFGPSVATDLPTWPRHAWTPAESTDQLLLMRVMGAEGGLPPWAELRPRLEVDWASARQRAEAEAALDEVVARYRFEEP